MRLDGLSLAYRSHMGIRNDGWLRLFLNRHLMEQRGACVLARTNSDDARHSTILVG